MQQPTGYDYKTSTSYISNKPASLRQTDNPRGPVMASRNVSSYGSCFTCPESRHIKWILAGATIVLVLGLIWYFSSSSSSDNPSDDPPNKPGTGTEVTRQLRSDRDGILSGVVVMPREQQPSSVQVSTSSTGTDKFVSLTQSASDPSTWQIGRETSPIRVNLGELLIVRSWFPQTKSSGASTVMISPQYTLVYQH